MNILIISVSVIVFSLLSFSKKVRQSSDWQAMVTPLASIMGSGFLVSAPLLSGAAGNYAVFCMSGLLLLAFLVGEAIRYNIINFEPISTGNGAAQKVAWCSRLMLALAYFTSVSYYLQLLGAFVLHAFNLDNLSYSKILSTSLLVIIGLVGIVRGLGVLEKVEKVTVSLNLAMISGLLVALMVYNGQLLNSAQWRLNNLPVAFGFDDLKVILGLLIVVQGFETSRYLGNDHSPEQRVRTMKFAQIISSVIYIVFLGCMTVLFKPGIGADVTAIIGLTARVSSLLPILISIAAIGSQFSASVADNEGAAGLIEEISEKKISEKLSYLLILFVTVTLTWSTDVTEIIAYASRMFALYYMLQCLVAFLVAKDNKAGSTKESMFMVLSIICFFVFLFGKPAG